MGECDRVIHLVDVIAGQNDGVVAMEALDDFLILMNGVCSALIPNLTSHSLIGGQNVYEFIELATQEAPGHLDVLDEAMAGVLREYRDSSDARIHGVREREIDDPKLAAEVDSGFGAIGREIEETAASASGEHDRRGTARQLEAGHDIVANHLKALRPIFDY
jgi:hypothetical protein